MRRLLLGLLLIVLPTLGGAQALEQRISDELATQGFAVTAMYRTWLGRLRVIAESDSQYRELVFDPATGELLQDYVELLANRERRLTADDDDRRDRNQWADVVAEPEMGVSIFVPEVAPAPGTEAPGDVTFASEGAQPGLGGAGE